MGQYAVVQGDGQRIRQLAIEQYAATTSHLDARADLHRGFSVAKQPWHQWVLDQVALVSGETVVELGAGTGLLWTVNSSRLPAGLRLHLTDLSMAMCHRLLADVPAVATVSCCDAQRVPFRDGSADVLIANHMLYHVPDQAATLAECSRVLRPGGRAIFATNGRDHMKELAPLLQAVGLTDPWAEPTHQAFTLEDAPRIVGKVFARVDVARFDDGLKVDDPNAVMAYIESFAQLDLDQRTPLRREISRRMTDGHLAITKSAGLIRAHAG